VTLSYNEIFFLATLGGAHVLNLEDKIGNFEIGKEFDALVVDAAAPGKTPQRPPECKCYNFLQNCWIIARRPSALVSVACC